MTLRDSTADSKKASNHLQYASDIVIFGGGIAGLWLLNTLKAHGFSVVLFESNQLGAGQTLASQGIIHGGLKYALSGALSSATNAIADMPNHWRSCLAGRGDIDLRSCRVLSDHYYMWSESTLRSKIKTFLGSKSLRGKIDPVTACELPAFFTHDALAGILYKLSDFVVDTPSLLKTLIEPHKQSILSTANAAVSFAQSTDVDSPFQQHIHLTKDDLQITVKTKRVILCAGEGNGELLKLAGLQSASMQTRPLKMVYLKAKDLPAVYCHCIGNDFRVNPKMTITTHDTEDGQKLWYIGGDIAELGVKQSDEALVDRAKHELSRLFPHLDLSNAQWGTLDINRAENSADKHHRPDNPYMRHKKGFIITWPTKLTLTPALSEAVTELLSTDSVQDTGDSHTAGLSDLLGFPSLAKPRWD